MTGDARAVLDGYLTQCRALVLDEMRRMVPRGRRGEGLYELMMEYPLREAKALRPALCIATCRALGGRVEDALPTATALELYHNAFLLHDDVEDGSLLRRGAPTLHRTHGAPVAINVGDAMLALSLQPLLDNVERIGLGKALRILKLVARMARESAEGQATELAWIRDDVWDLDPRAYTRLVYQKTCWYTFVAPMLAGALAAMEPFDNAKLWALERVAIQVGVAFQIHDDVLNLDEGAQGYGKELAGDLWEAKRTLIVLHALSKAAPDERAALRATLSKPRELKADGEMRWVLERVRHHGSVAHAMAVAGRWARRARRSIEALPWLPDSPHRAVLVALTRYVTERTR